MKKSAEDAKKSLAKKQAAREEIGRKTAEKHADVGRVGIGASGDIGRAGIKASKNVGKH